MAVIGLILGSTLGALSGMAGWLMWDMSALTAFSLYLCTSFATAALMIMIGMIGRGQQSETEAVEA
jgi:uncharacterized membrane protein